MPHQATTDGGDQNHGDGADDNRLPTLFLGLLGHRLLLGLIHCSLLLFDHLILLLYFAKLLATMRPNVALRPALMPAARLG